MPAMLRRTTPSRPSPVRGSRPLSTRETRLLEGVADTELALPSDLVIADGVPAPCVPTTALPAGVNVPAISPDSAGTSDPPGANSDPTENVPSWLVPREPVAEFPPPACTVPAELLAELPPVPPMPAVTPFPPEPAEAPIGPD
jgi:hypothetical protein